MATTAQIQSVIADCQENRVSYDDLAAILERAILNAIITASGTVDLPWQSIGSDSTNIVRMTLDSAKSLLDFALQRAGGGIVSQFTEFRNPR